LLFTQCRESSSPYGVTQAIAQICISGMNWIYPVSKCQCPMLIIPAVKSRWLYGVLWRFSRPISRHHGGSIYVGVAFPTSATAASWKGSNMHQPRCTVAIGRWAPRPFHRLDGGCRARRNRKILIVEAGHTACAPWH
jgi:hypothetical protein